MKTKFHSVQACTNKAVSAILYGLAYIAAMGTCMVAGLWIHGMIV